MRRFLAITFGLLAFVSATAGEPTNMVRIPTGEYQLPFREESEPKSVAVKEFLIDVYPVTNVDFLEFVRANANWRKSQVKRLFADEEYLRDWKADLDLGNLNPRAPVTRVSWFAARAYAKWSGKRLPMTAEWEMVALANETSANASGDRAFRQALQNMYLQPALDVLPAVGMGKSNYYGVHDMHGLVWEWVADFSTAMVTGDARGDTGLDRQLFCGGGGQGAKDRGDFPAFMRFAFRSSLSASYTVPNLGFRCVKDL
jgi:formylglycine-generating enzyme required for sulfatase activity